MYVFKWPKRGVLACAVVALTLSLGPGGDVDRRTLPARRPRGLSVVQGAGIL
jgi:hypothetical protein